MNPEIFLRIILLTAGREVCVQAFALGQFIGENGRMFALNFGSQYVAYLTAQAAGNTVPTLLPILTNGKTVAQWANTPEKTAVAGLVFITGTAVTYRRMLQWQL